MRRAVILFVLATAPSAALGQDFCADRPGLATGTCIVPAGTVQLETALASWSRDTTSGVRADQWTLGASEARFGLGAGSEIQLGWTPWTRFATREHGRRNRHAGVGDARLGYKLTLADTGRVTLAILPSIKLPLAPRPLGNRRIELGLLAPVDLDLGGSWDLTLTPEVDWNADGDRHGHHVLLAGAAGIGLALAPTVATSLNLRIARERDGGVTMGQTAAGATLAWLARPNLQFDVEADKRLSGEAPDLQLFAGVSLRR